MPTKEQDPKVSRFDKHLNLLGLDGKAPLPERELAADRLLMEQAQPKRLVFPSERSEPARRQQAAALFKDFGARWMAGGALLVAATVAALVYQQRQSPEEGRYTVKGAANVEVFFEQKGAVAPWTPGVHLDEGAKVRAEVLAVKPSLAFWAVTGRGGKLLNTASWIWENRQLLTAGEKKFFQGSLELAGASEGEVLTVAVCPTEDFNEEAKNNAEIAAGLFRSPAATLPGCHLQHFPLRD